MLEIFDIPVGGLLPPGHTFAGLPRNTAKVIYADPPWLHETWSEKGKDRSPDQHYDTMPFDDICAMPVDDLTARDAWLFLWFRNPMKPSQIEILMNAWGFEYSSVAFTWLKLNPSGEGYHGGNGYGTRQNTERVYLGRKGSPIRVDKSVPEVVIWPRDPEHSKKPNIVRHRIKRFCGGDAGGPYVELFARKRSPGWLCFGNELDKFPPVEPGDEREEDFASTLVE